MFSRKGTARLAGVLYVLASATGVFSYLYLPAVFIASGDPAATARRILERAVLYRLGIVSDVLSSVLLLWLALTLYDLLRDAGRHYARLMVSLVAVAVAVAIVNVINLIAPLLLVSGAVPLEAFTAQQRDVLAFFFLKLRASGLFLAQIFWGLWLFPFGMLVMRSRLIPKIFGVLLIASCAAYVTHCLVYILMPAQQHVAQQLLQPIEGLGELAIILWLLVKGVRDAPAAA